MRLTEAEQRFVWRRQVARRRDGHDTGACPHCCRCDIFLPIDDRGHWWFGCSVCKTKWIALNGFADMYVESEYERIWEDMVVYAGADAPARPECLHPHRLGPYGAEAKDAWRRLAEVTLQEWPAGYYSQVDPVAEAVAPGLGLADA
jgi:hypothetical protein